MYGAILGDIIGSPYEFDVNNIKTKNFPLFSERSEYTDDSIMTCAVAEALLACEKDADDETIKAALVRSMKKFGKAYPFAGYGVNFSMWLASEEAKPYGSFGNGSAMRVSPAALLYQDDFARAMHVAALTSAVTHDHPEGIKGAQATAAVIVMALHGRSKEEIRAAVTKAFGYDLSKTCDEIRPTYHHVESCQETVPQAIAAFLEGTDFEDVIRTAISLGGDSDTLAAIAGSMAEAFYGVPQSLREEVHKRLPDDLEEVLNRFEERLAKDKADREKDPALKQKWENAFGAPAPRQAGAKTSARPTGPDFRTAEAVESCMEQFAQNKDRESLVKCLEEVRKAMGAGGFFMVPLRGMPQTGQAVPGGKGIKVQIQVIRTNDGKLWQMVYTSPKTAMESLRKAGREKDPQVALPIRAVLSRFAQKQDGEDAVPSEIEGVMVSSGSRSLFINRKTIAEMLRIDALAAKGAQGSTLSVTKADITKLKVDCIVNAANRTLLGGGGVDGAIHRAAGPELLAECRKLGGCETGDVKATGGYQLPASVVLHAVGPIYGTTGRDAELLSSCYTKALDLAKERDLHSIAFPNISTGVYGYPKQEAAETAIGAVVGWIKQNPQYLMKITFACFDDENFRIYKEKLQALAKPGTK